MKLYYYLNSNLEQIKYIDYDGSSLDITSYTSTNKFTIPKNGIVRVAVKPISGSWIYVAICDKKGNLMYEVNVNTNNSIGQSTVVPVYKGQMVYVVNGSTSNKVVFYFPFE